MRCNNCGSEIYSGQKFCVSCGQKLDARNTARTEKATIYITEAEAQTGCQKDLNLPGFPTPMRFSLKPGMTDKRILEVKNARFVDSDGNVVIRPLEVTIRVKNKPHPSTTKKSVWKYIAIAAVICLVVFVAYRGSMEYSDVDSYNGNTNNTVGQSNSDLPVVPNNGNIFAEGTDKQYGGHTPQEMLEDIMEEDNYYTNHNLIPQQATITKSLTENDGKKETIWVDVVSENGDCTYTGSYIVEYIKYDEGWQLYHVYRDDYYALAKTGADDAFVEDYLKRTYGEGVYACVNSTLNGNYEAKTYEIAVDRSEYLTAIYQVDVSLAYMFPNGWLVDDVSELDVLQCWKNIVGTWECHNDDVDIILNITDFDGTANTAVLNYSVCTYIDLGEYKLDEYYPTTTRITPGIVYRNTSVQVIIDDYSDVASNTYVINRDASKDEFEKRLFVYDDSGQELFKFCFCGTERGFVNTNNEYDNEESSTGVCVWLEGWGGSGGCAFWLTKTD